MPVEMKEQTALTALRDELRKVFEPFGARVELFELHLGRRMLRWRARTPDYPSHHVGGAMEEWVNSGRHNKQHQIVITILRDDGVLEPENAPLHAELLKGRWVPERLSVVKIVELMRVFGIDLSEPEIRVLAAGGIWSSR